MINIILAVTFLAAIGLVAVLGFAIHTARSTDAKPASLSRGGASD